jgi:hypothetical protein
MSTGKNAKLGQKMARGSRTPLDVRQAIERIAASRDVSARAIIEELNGDRRYAGRVPEERTVQQISRPFRGDRRDASGQWSLAAVAPRDAGAAGFVLDAIKAAYAASDGRVTMVTNAEAEWIERIARARPDLPPEEWYAYARMFLVRGDEIDDLQLSLALGGLEGVIADRYR